MTLDVSQTRKPPFSRLVTVELRKMGDTRAGMWLLITMGLITAAAIGLFFAFAPNDELRFENFIGVTSTPQGFLLPVLGILLVTQEWGQRTALTTFALTPSRPRVIAAKVAAALVLGVAVIVLAVVIAALATVLAGQPDAWEGITAEDFVIYALLQVSGILQGLAFGLILLNSSAAIVLYFVIPTAFSILANVWTAFEDAKHWVDLGTAQGDLFNADEITSTLWMHVLVASLIWIAAPFLAGLWRVMRAELK